MRWAGAYPTKKYYTTAPRDYAVTRTELNRGRPCARLTCYTGMREH